MTDTGIPEHQLVLQALSDAEDFWTGYRHIATSYLRSRSIGWTDDVNLPIGYAPSSPDALTRHLQSAGYNETTLLASGLVIRTRRGTLVDRFRGRVMFPIRHPTSAATVGAIGRDITGRAGAPKYLNSPTNSPFNKSELLYGLVEQQHRLAAGVTPLLVEGPIDALAMAISHPELVPVASCGTALTPRHVDILRRRCTSQTILVAYDADDAGLRATVNAYRLLRPAFRDPRWLRLAAGTDPADTLRRSGATVGLCEHTPPLADAVIAAAMSGQSSASSPEMIKAIKIAGRAVARLHPDDWQQEISSLSQQLNVDPVAIQQAVVEMPPGAVSR